MSNGGHRVWQSSSVRLADILLVACVQPQGTVDHFISSLISDDIDLDGSANGTITGGATYYSPVIHTTTIGPLEPGVTYFYRVSVSNITCPERVVECGHRNPGCLQMLAAPNMSTLLATRIPGARANELKSKR